MTQPPLFSKEEFVEFVLNQIKQSLPEAEFERTDLMSYHVKLDDNRGFEMNFHNMWKNYEYSNDLNVAVEFLNAQLDMLQLENEPEAWKTRKEYIYPAIRDARFPFYEHSTLLHELPHTELALTYAVDYPRFSMFMQSNEQSPTSEEMKKLAIQNLMREGWIEPVDVEDTPAGKLMIFEYDEREFNYQFFIDSFVEQHLAPYFFFSLPAKTHALVYIPTKMDPFASAQLLIMMKQITVDMYQKLGHSISPQIYVSEQGEIRSFEP